MKEQVRRVQFSTFDNGVAEMTQVVRSRLGDRTCVYLDGCAVGARTSLGLKQIHATAVRSSLVKRLQACERVTAKRKRDEVKIHAPEVMEVLQGERNVDNVWNISKQTRTQRVILRNHFNLYKSSGSQDVSRKRSGTTMRRKHRITDRTRSANNQEKRSYLRHWKLD